MLILLTLMSCSDKSTESADTSDNTTTSADSSADSGTTDSPTAPACATVSSGTEWAWYGECPQMTTPCDLVVDGCSITIDYEADGGMTMQMPGSGIIEGDTITFGNERSVTGCVGTVESPDSISGSCDSGCTFTLRQ